MKTLFLILASILFAACTSTSTVTSSAPSIGEPCDGGVYILADDDGSLTCGSPADVCDWQVNGDSCGVDGEVCTWGACVKPGVDPCTELLPGDVCGDGMVCSVSSVACVKEAGK